MPLYMDIHDLTGLSSEEVSKAHHADVKLQASYGVEYRRYWFNEHCGKAFCLIDAPDAETATRVHREAHGHVADKIIEVQPELADSFLGGGEVNSAGAVVAPGAQVQDSGIRTILFTDMVDSTSITQAIGDEAAMAILQAHDETVRSALKEQGGREVKHTGDGIMASFVSAAAAVKCASQIQRDLGKRLVNSQPVIVRIGLAAGEPVEHNDDLFGSTVQLAARLCAHAQPTQIVVSNVVAELCLGKSISFHELGEVMLKGFTSPVRAHTVAWTHESP
ncbi:MAG: nickel-binding protein [Chthoniobacterales bacterium]